ncbi:MAG: hypothetical protein Q4A11_07525, partial [Brachymonas sp.]|nr:hypothetical protein [Brachymonas sp.]
IQFRDDFLRGHGRRHGKSDKNRSKGFINSPRFETAGQQTTIAANSMQPQCNGIDQPRRHFANPCRSPLLA